MEETENKEENKIFKTKQNAVWEQEPIEYSINYKLSEWEKEEYTCKHIKDGILPIVIIAINEGGYNSTGICGLCAVEIVKNNT